jgi:F420-dependent oxidoreductase-like protein
VSGPQIVEGWYGQPWGRPNPRIRDYVAIIRKILAREAPVTHDGTEISLPYDGPGSSGLAKPLRSILHMNPRIPIWLGTGTEANVKLTAEIADGWLPLGLTPHNADLFVPWIEEGFRRAEAKTGQPKGWSDFEVQASCTVELTDDVGSALRKMKPNVALYVGGMGHRTLNFHKMSMIRRGYGEEAERIQELYMAGRKAEAMEEVPDDFLDEQSLVGPPARIRERYRAWVDSYITGITVNSDQPDALELMAELAQSNL